MKLCAHYALAPVLLMLGTAAAADARSDYYQRAAATDMASFHALDTDHDNSLTRTEVEGDNNFGPRFNDMDINRDGIVTLDELHRYIEQHYGVAAPAGGK